MKQLTNLRKAALAGYLETITKDIKHEKDKLFSYCNYFYLVLLDHEADIAFNEVIFQREAIPYGWNK